MSLWSAMKRLLCVIALWFLAARVTPFPHHKLAMAPQNTRYVDSGGVLLRRTLGVGDFDADWLPLSRSGPWAGPALVAVEDQRFFQHPGVDPLAILRAMGQNLHSGRVVSGASTLSTQVIKMIEPRPRTLRTKLIEAFRATQLEWHYDKEEILEQYLNRAPFGGNRQGIATAARRYFGAEPELLAASEAALLVGLPQSPERLRPDRFPEEAEVRRQQVIRRMMEEGILSEAPPAPELEKGLVRPPMEAYHFTEWIRRRQRLDPPVIHTTLDLRLQRICEAVAEAKKTDLNFAEVDGMGILLMEAQTGRVRAWVGSWDTRHPYHGKVDTVTRRRAAGSTLKPFAYAMAMQRGWLTPETRLEDNPQSYRDYQPRNMDLTTSGEVSATEALMRSLNLPAVQLVDRLGTDAFLQTLRAAGFALPQVRPDVAGLGMVLGGGMDVTLLELVSAYSVFARGGVGIRPLGVDGEAEDEFPLFSPGVAYWISRMLSAPGREGMLYGNDGDAVRPLIAFKTGTSHGNRDAWAVGWDEDWVLGVWVGRMDGASVEGLSGATHAAPVLGALARAIFGEADGIWPLPPADIRSQDGREEIEGVTLPDADFASPVQARIVHPPPDFHWRSLDAGPLLLQPQTAGAEGGEIHWFVNGTWIGTYPAEESPRISLDPGEHRLRAVFPDGTAEERRLIYEAPPAEAGNRLPAVLDS